MLRETELPSAIPRTLQGVVHHDDFYLVTVSLDFIGQRKGHGTTVPEITTLTYLLVLTPIGQVPGSVYPNQSNPIKKLLVIGTRAGVVGDEMDLFINLFLEILLEPL
jgi:hypothetical protein